ncbi:32270_t:CDS:2, partial [Racocetra persica]
FACLDPRSLDKSCSRAYRKPPEELQLEFDLFTCKETFKFASDVTMFRDSNELSDHGAFGGILLIVLSWVYRFQQ